MLWCTTTIGGWQQTTTIAKTVRAIRCRHRRWFRRLIIIALSRSGLSRLRSSTLLLLLLPSSCRFHRSRCSSRITTAALTSPTDIHNSCLSFVYFSWKNALRTSSLSLSLTHSLQTNVECWFNYRWMSIGQCLFLHFVRFFFIIVVVFSFSSSLPSNDKCELVNRKK